MSHLSLTALSDIDNIIISLAQQVKSTESQGRRKFTVGFNCVRTTDDEKKYPHFDAV